MNNSYSNHVSNILSFDAEDKYQAIGEIFLLHMELLGCDADCSSKLRGFLDQCQDQQRVTVKEYIDSHHPVESNRFTVEVFLKELFSANTKMEVDLTEQPAFSQSRVW